MLDEPLKTYSCSINVGSTAAAPLPRSATKDEMTSHGAWPVLRLVSCVMSETKTRMEESSRGSLEERMSAT